MIHIIYCFSVYAGEGPKQKVINLKGKLLSEAYETEITHLKPYTNYSVQLQAFTTKNGVSDNSDKIYVRTKEDGVYYNLFDNVVDLVFYVFKAFFPQQPKKSDCHKLI